LEAKITLKEYFNIPSSSYNVRFGATTSTHLRVMKADLTSPAQPASLVRICERF